MRTARSPFDGDVPGASLGFSITFAVRLAFGLADF